MPFTFREMREAFERSCRDQGALALVAMPDLSEHPLHALYLDNDTQRMWLGWKAAYIANRLYAPNAEATMP